MITILNLSRILRLILMGGRGRGTSKILPILYLFTSTLTILDHVLILAHERKNSQVGFR